MSAVAPVKLDALYIYPIKSCAGIRLETARLTSRGLEHDRRWMVTDASGKFLSQRTAPEMQKVKLAVEAERLVATRDGLPALALPLLTGEGARVPFEVWGHHGHAVRHEEGSAWFTRALGRAVQLVCMPDDVERAVYKQHAQPGDLVSFADGFPLLLVNRASLDDVSARAQLVVDERRFRPNLVLSGAPAWAEDGWKRIRVGAITMRVPKPCARCSIPGVDPDTAEATKEPLKTLAT
ncbi:MAG: Flavodoxin reductase (ferredoxin-NADPH reductase) family 1, partial [Myxococcales bacterium]|nr:Flavodoxin reductase (ferredoxin-NADPH reductase) family 1 [Myxococcales bacterium]